MALKVIRLLLIGDLDHLCAIFRGADSSVRAGFDQCAGVESAG